MEGQIVVRGKLDTARARFLAPPLYRFGVSADGMIFRNELWMVELGACRIITVRLPLPLELKPDLEYTLILEHEDGDAQIFLLSGSIGPIKADLEAMRARERFNIWRLELSRVLWEIKYWPSRFR